MAKEKKYTKEDVKQVGELFNEFLKTKEAEFDAGINTVDLFVIYSVDDNWIWVYTELEPVEDMPDWVENPDGFEYAMCGSGDVEQAATFATKRDAELEIRKIAKMAGVDAKTLHIASLSDARYMYKAQQEKLEANEDYRKAKADNAKFVIVTKCEDGTYGMTGVSKVEVNAKIQYSAVGSAALDKIKRFDTMDEARTYLQGLQDDPNIVCGDDWEVIKMGDYKLRRHLEKYLDKRRNEAKIPPRWEVWYYGENSETTQDSFGFVRYEKGVPLFSNRPCAAMQFKYRRQAAKVAEHLGEGFTVVDMWSVMSKEERLLWSIFSDEAIDDEPEYYGDGTRAEDEDWDS